jgi:hypothetical protein
MLACRYFCPQCGRVFEEAAWPAVCPDCRAPLQPAAPTDDPPADGPLNLPPNLDVGALMRQVLAEEPQEETVDEALGRVLQREYPQAGEPLFRLLCEMLGALQRVWGISRLEGVQRVAQARSEMHLSPEGRPEITSVQVQAAGLEQLPPEQREQVLRQLEEAARTGKPMPQRIVLTPAKAAGGCAGMVLAVIAAIGAAVCYCVGHMLAVW